MTDQSWFGVRCVLRGPNGLYEERVTLWEAAGFAQAIELAEQEVAVYAAAIGSTYLELAQAFEMFDPPGNGTEVFSLLRESDLEPKQYLNRFFDTGGERQQSGD